MEKNITGRRALQTLDIFFDSLTFISIQYLLLCCMYSFRASVVYVFFIALNASVVCKHWTNLKNAIPNKVLFAVVFVMNFVVLAAFILMFGYLEISPILKEVL